MSTCMRASLSVSPCVCVCLYHGQIHLGPVITTLEKWSVSVLRENHSVWRSLQSYEVGFNVKTLFQVQFVTKSFPKHGFHVGCNCVYCFSNVEISVYTRIGDLCLLCEDLDRLKKQGLL